MHYRDEYLPLLQAVRKELDRTGRRRDAERQVLLTMMPIDRLARILAWARNEPDKESA